VWEEKILIIEVRGVGGPVGNNATSPPSPCLKLSLGFIPSKKKLNMVFLDDALMNAKLIMPNFPL
jgi:hypothetical protein